MNFVDKCICYKNAAIIYYILFAIRIVFVAGSKTKPKPENGLCVCDA